MRSTLVAPLVITIFLVIILIFYFTNFPKISRDVIIFGLTILQIISLFFLYFLDSSESFYFEVSPERKKCLLEQVSLNPTGERSCQCCGKGTVGGYPPYYRDWLIPEGENQLWKRTDNYTTNPLSPAYETQIPPTELVTEKKKIKLNNDRYR